MLIFFLGFPPSPTETEEVFKEICTFDCIIGFTWDIYSGMLKWQRAIYKEIMEHFAYLDRARGATGVRNERCIKFKR